MIDKVILYCLKNRQHIKYLLIIATLTTLFLTMLPSENFGNSRLLDFDKIGHFLIFFGWTLIYGLFMFSKKRTEMKFILIFLTGCLFGVFIEIFQGILPIGRTMDTNDALTDILGSLAAILLLFAIKRRYLSRDMEKHLKKI